MSQVNLWDFHREGVWRHFIVFHQGSQNVILLVTRSQNQILSEKCAKVHPSDIKRHAPLSLPSPSLPLNQQDNFLSPANMQSPMWSLTQFHMFPGCLQKERQLPPLEGPCLWRRDVKLKETTDRLRETCVAEVWYLHTGSIHLFSILNTNLHYNSSSYRFHMTPRRCVESLKNHSTSSICSVPCMQAACCFPQLSTDDLLRPMEARAETSAIWQTSSFFLLFRIRTTRGQQNEQ